MDCLRKVHMLKLAVVILIVLNSCKLFGHEPENSSSNQLLMDGVQKTFIDNLPTLRHCYQKEIDIQNSPIEGIIRLDMVINDQGDVESASIEAASKNLPQNISRCLVNVAKSLKFPKLNGGGKLEINQPFNFFIRDANEEGIQDNTTEGYEFPAEGYALFIKNILHNSVSLVAIYRQVFSGRSDCLQSLNSWEKSGYEARCFSLRAVERIESFTELKRPSYTLFIKNISAGQKEIVAEYFQAFSGHKDCGDNLKNWVGSGYEATCTGASE